MGCPGVQSGMRCAVMSAIALVTAACAGCVRVACLGCDRAHGRYVRQCELAGFEVHSVETIGRHYAHTLHKWYDNWMSHKDKILSGKIDAISHHTTGKHLFRLQEFFLAWSVIAAGQGTATCYQLVCHPNTYDYPRDQWVDKSQVSGPHLVGVGLQNGDSPLQKPNSKADAVRPVAKRVAAMKAISVKNSLHQY